MLTRPARVAIENSDPKEELALVLSWTAEIDLAKLGGIAPGPARQAFATQFYDEAKRPVLQQLREMQGVSVVDPLEGMHTAILAAKAAVWQKMLENGNSPLESGEVKVLPNRVVATALSA